MTKEIARVEVKNARELTNYAGRYARVSKIFPDLYVELQIKKDNPHLLMLTADSKDGFAREQAFSLQDTTPTARFDRTKVDPEELARATRFVYNSHIGPGEITISTNKAITLRNDRESTAATIPYHIGDNHCEPTAEILPQTALTNRRALYQALKSVSFSCEPEDPPNNPYSRIYVEATGREMNLMTTDQYRLGFCRLKLNHPLAFDEMSFSVLKRHFIQGERMLGRRHKEDVLLNINEPLTHLTMAGSNRRSLQASIPIVVGNFPDWLNVIPPPDSGETITFNSGELHSRMKMFKSGKSDRVIIKSQETSSGWVLSVRQDQFTSQGKGKNRATLKHDIKTAVPASSGFDGEIAISTNYLKDILRLHPGQNTQMSLQFNGFDAPLVLKFVGDDRFTHLMIPRNV